MSRRLLLLRHGQTEYNVARRMQGHLDTELSDVGVTQAQRAAETMAELHVGKIISSDLKRAHDTALVVAEKFGLPVTTDPRLRETNLGDWQGKTHMEVDEHFPGARARWRFDAHWAPPNAETRQQVAKRARQVVDELLAQHQEWEDHAVLIVAHGGTISALSASLLGLAESKHPIFSNLGNTRWAQLVGRPVLDEVQQHTGTHMQWYLEGWNVDSSLS